MAQGSSPGEAAGRAGWQVNILDQLRRDEGEVLHAYTDSLGYLTIGVGRLIDSRRGGRISQEESEMLLQNDVARITSALRTHLPWFASVDSVRQAVLINMGFALGFEGLLGFHDMLSHMAGQLWGLASQDLLDSKWASKVGNRAKRLAIQLNLGEWQ